MQFINLNKLIRAEKYEFHAVKEAVAAEAISYLIILHTKENFMKKSMVKLFLAGTAALSLCGCTKDQTDKVNIDVETEITQEGSVIENEQDLEDAFSFINFEDLQFEFCSGAGGWATRMTIKEDGSFSGEFFDGELGLTGEDYPKGTMYQCDFTGQFTEPEKINDYTYSMQISEIEYRKESGTEEIIDGVLYCYSTPYGLDGADNILIYLPGAPLQELPEEFRSWVGYYDISGTEDKELPFYGLYNEKEQCGFSSYKIADSVTEMISATEEWAKSVEDSILHDDLNQAELNEKSQLLYEIWDSALNSVWSELKETLDEETMNALIIEEREWIANKEQAVKEAGSEVEGGSMYSMIINQKAAELTKTRVYELMEYFSK